MTEDRFWKLVEKIGWKTKSFDTDKLGIDLLNYVTDVQEIKDMREISGELRNRIDPIVYNYAEKHPKFHFWGGDDSFWDFTAHIVGLGKKYYYEVLKNPKSMAIAGEDYEENFEYIFTAAEEFAKTEEGQKILKYNKRGPKFNRIMK